MTMNYTRDFFASKGAKGGSARSAAKLAAAKRNLSKTPTHTRRAEILAGRNRPRLPSPKEMPKLPG